MAEVAEILTKALATDEAKNVCPEAHGKRITYEPQDIEQFEQDFGPTRAEFFEYLRNGFYSRCSPDFYNITGKRPMTYFEYLTTEGAAGDTGLAELFSSQGAIFTKRRPVQRSQKRQEVIIVVNQCTFVFVYRHPNKR